MSSEEENAAPHHCCLLSHTTNYLSKQTTLQSTLGFNCQTTVVAMSSEEENAACHDCTECEFEESDVLENPDPCVAGAIPFPNKELSEIEEKDVEKQRKARATFMDSFNSSPMKLAESCYPDPLFLPEVIDLTDDAARLQAKVKVRDISEDQAIEKATKEALVAMVKSTFLDAYKLDVDICPSGNKKLPGTDFKDGQLPQKCGYSYKAQNVFHCKRCWEADKFSPIMVCQFVKEQTQVKRMPAKGSLGKSPNQKKKQDREKTEAAVRIGIKFLWLTDHSSECQSSISEKKSDYMQSKHANLRVHHHIFEDTYDELVVKVNEHEFEPCFIDKSVPEAICMQIRKQFKEFNEMDDAKEEDPQKEKGKPKKKYGIFAESTYKSMMNKATHSIKPPPPVHPINFGILEMGRLDDRGYLLLPTHPSEYPLDMNKHHRSCARYAFLLACQLDLGTEFRSWEYDPTPYAAYLASSTRGKTAPWDKCHKPTVTPAHLFLREISLIIGGNEIRVSALDPIHQRTHTDGNGNTSLDEVLEFANGSLTKPFSFMTPLGCDREFYIHHPSYRYVIKNGRCVVFSGDLLHGGITKRGPDRSWAPAIHGHMDSTKHERVQGFLAVQEMHYKPDIFLELYLKPEEASNELFEAWARHDVALTVLAKHEPALRQRLEELNDGDVDDTALISHSSSFASAVARLPPSVDPGDVFDSPSKPLARPDSIEADVSSDDLAKDSIDANMIRFALQHLSEPTIGDKVKLKAITQKAQKHWKKLMKAKPSVPASKLVEIGKGASIPKSLSKAAVSPTLQDSKRKSHLPMSSSAKKHKTPSAKKCKLSTHRSNCDMEEES